MTPDYKKILKLSIQLAGILFVGIIFLNLFGKIFIEEISQNLFVENKKIQEDVLAISEVAPYFELQNLNGKLIKITDLKGSPVVLVFWSTWNEVSGSQLKIIDDISYKYSNLFKTLAINSQENREVVSNFVKRGTYTKTEILLDINGGISDIYEARSIPAFYFIDKNGLLMSTYYGFLNEREIVEKMSKFSN
ncbi:MAG: Peroxiredoxin [Parcubacteria group bacterium GW2011_GWF2_38_76]|nr:MAG: Peroxiredoxin [Parcubacteria group bacterium GW2011_GWF2_38_76]HBM45708.1 hypothetical protein [Patescibacteria group bacterium]